MIERKFVAQKMKEHQIQEYIMHNLKNVGHSNTKMVKTPLGEKIILYASRPGLIVGRKGENIKELTKTLKKRFELENPQVEISEVEKVFLDAKIVAEKITGSLERFGAQKFKAIGHKIMENVMSAGALGVEIIVSGKIPSSRAKSWRFYSGYLKKCGDIAIAGVDKAHAQAKLKTGVIGVKVSIMPPGTMLPDKVELIEEKEEKIEEVKEAQEEAEKKAEKKEGKPKARRKAKVKKEKKDEESSEKGMVKTNENES
ncbi:30S ribosomal protein S3 [Candidatus Woesearchaeota archaeon]|nr:30S ribosomal protein S3 [Candidatus Woesearchaeota archaeon]